MHDEHWISAAEPLKLQSNPAQLRKAPMPTLTTPTPCLQLPAKPQRAGRNQARANPHTRRRRLSSTTRKKTPPAASPSLQYNKTSKTHPPLLLSNPSAPFPYRPNSSSPHCSLVSDARASLNLRSATFLTKPGESLMSPLRSQ